MLFGCRAEDEENAGNRSFHEVYSGVVTNAVGVGGDNGGFIRFSVDVGNGVAKDFTTTLTTKVEGVASTYDVNIGSHVEIECESKTNSDYHAILTLTAKTGPARREIYTGTVTLISSVDNGKELLTCFTVAIDLKTEMQFTTTTTTKVIGAARPEDISNGSLVEIECESYKDYAYHRILSITVY